MRGAQANQTFGGLTGQYTLFGGLNTVIDGIAQQVGQGRFEFFQHIAINLGFFALNFQANRLAQRAPQITHHALLPHQHVGKRPHATSQRGVVKQLRTLTRVPAKLIQLSGLLAEQMLRLGHYPPRIGQCLLRFMAQPRVLELLA